MFRSVLLVTFAVHLSSADDVGYEAGFSDFRKEWSGEAITLKGSLPKWLIGGAHVMNGVSLWRFPKRKMMHNLDGYAKIHAVEFTSATTASFSGQFVRSGFYNESIKKNDVSAALLFEETVPPRFAMPLQNALAPNDNINVNVVRINGKVQLISDLVGTVIMNRTMGTERVCVDGHLPGAHQSFVDEPAFPKTMPVTMGSAHPLSEHLSSDQNTGDWYGIVAATQAVSFEPIKSELLRVFKVSPAGDSSTLPTEWMRRKEVITLPLPKAPYMHAFGFVTPEGAKPGRSANFQSAVLVHHPFYMDLTKEFPAYKKPMEEIWEFKRDEPVRFYVVDLKNGTLSANLTLNGEPFIFSHVLNSFQLGQSIYLDLVAYKDSFFKRYSFAVLFNKTARDAFARSEVLRFKLDLVAGTVTQQLLLPGADIELPTINEYFKGRQNCYAWSWENNFQYPGSDAGATGWASMAAVKFDLCKSAKEGRTVRTAYYQPYTYYGETFFVPRPGGTLEDDGVVMVPSLDGTTGRMTLLVLDAATMKPLAEAPLPEGAGGYMTHTRFLFDFANGQAMETLII